MNPPPRARRAKSEEGRDRLILFLLLAGAPIIGAVVVVYRVWRGDLTWSEAIPDTLIWNVPYLMMSIVLLAIGVWGLLPLFGAAERTAHREVQLARERRQQGGGIASLLESVGMPLRLLLLALARLAMGVGWVITFAAIAMFFLFLVRCFALEWVDGWLPIVPPDPRSWFRG